MTMLRSPKWHQGLWIALALLSAAAVCLYLQIITMNLPGPPFPDEISGYNLFRRDFGYFGAIKYYWHALIGRPGALAWFGWPMMIFPGRWVDPWQTLVVVRAFNWLLALACVAAFLRVVFDRLSILLCLGTAGLLLAASMSSLGGWGVTNLWVLDQAIYLLTFMLFCVVLLLCWRIAAHGPDRFAALLPPIFLLFLTAHEINLVTGSLILVFFFSGVIVSLSPAKPARGLWRPFWSAWHSLVTFKVRRSHQNLTWAHVSLGLCISNQLAFRIGKRQLVLGIGLGGGGVCFFLQTRSCHFDFGLWFRATKSFARLRWGHLRLIASLNYGSSRQKSVLLLATLGLLFVFAAAIQVFSPSLSHRETVWPIQATAREAAALGFISAFTPWLELGLGFQGAIIPMLLCGVAIGMFQFWRNPPARHLQMLLFVPLILALVTALVTATLSAVIGYLVRPTYFPDPKLGAIFDALGGKMLPQHQTHFVYQIWYVGVLFAGAGLAAVFTKPQHGVLKHQWQSALLFLPAAWLAYTVMASRAFSDSLAFDWRDQFSSTAERLAPLNYPSSFDGNSYIEEAPRHPLDYKGPNLDAYPLDRELQRMFRGGPVVFVPCGLAGAKNECSGTDLPVVERKFDSATTGLAGIWVGRIHATAELRQPKANHDQSFLSTTVFPKGNRTLVAVTMVIEPVVRAQAVTGFEQDVMLGVTSVDGSATIGFKLGAQEGLQPAEFGARALDARVRKLSGAALELSARFVMVGESPTFTVLLGGVAPVNGTSETANRFNWRLIATRLRIVDSGRSVFRFEPNPLRGGNAGPS